MTATAGQRALSAGLRALQRVHPSRWSFGGRSWTGVAALLRPGDPRQLDEPTARLVLTVETCALPVPAPQGQDFIRNGTSSHRIIRVDHDATSGMSTFLLTATTAG